jgi:hypothetical protein
VSERITGNKIATWIYGNFLNQAGNPVTCVAFPPVIPEFPDEIIVVTLLPGTGLDHERAFESRTWQVRCRSPQNNPFIAEYNSIAIDGLLMSKSMPWYPINAHVIELGWTGGGPSPMPADDSSNRYSWVCSYYSKSATGY